MIFFRDYGRDKLRMGCQQSDFVTPLFGLQGDLRSRAAGENIGDASNLVDGHLGIASGDEDAHEESADCRGSLRNRPPGANATRLAMNRWVAKTPPTLLYCIR